MHIENNKPQRRGNRWSDFKIGDIVCEDRTIYIVTLKGVVCLGKIDEDISYAGTSYTIDPDDESWEFRKLSKVKLVIEE